MEIIEIIIMGQVTKMRLSCYLVLQPGNKIAAVPWPDPYKEPVAFGWCHMNIMASQITRHSVVACLD